MIVTVTPNPSVDRTLFITSLLRGAVIRSERSLSEPSGKGVNVAYALSAHGIDVLAVVPAGGPTGAELVQMLAAAGVAHVVVAITGSVRSNISLVEPDGTVTKVNEPGPLLGAGEAERLTTVALQRAGRGASWIAGCGSLPAGAAPDLYATLTRRARRLGVRTAVDTSGPALRAALRQRPDLVKPNVDELAELSGRPLRTLGDVVDSAADVRTLGAGAVLASLGADGAVLVDDAGALHGEAPVESLVSAVGAGDAMLAGFLAGGGAGPRALRNGLAWAAAQVQHEGTSYRVGQPEVPVTLHHHLDRDRVLVHRAEPPPPAPAVDVRPAR